MTQFITDRARRDDTRPTLRDELPGLKNGLHP
jgi:hypothetical protein